MFRIIRYVPPYTPSKMQGILESGSILRVHKKAFEQLCEHIGFGKDMKDNQVEQGGFLLGEVYSVQENYVIIVHTVLPARTAEGSMRHLHFDHHTWHSFLEEQEKLISSSKQLVGWYHTHPKHLQVYFSETDKDNHQRFFGQDWHVGLVINPQREEMKCFLGNNFEVIQIEILKK